MHLMYHLDAEGKRVYTLKKIVNAKATKSAHPARFSPDDKYSRHRVTLKKRFNLLPMQQSGHGRVGGSSNTKAGTFTSEKEGVKEEAVKKGQNFVFGGVDGVLNAHNKRAGMAFKKFLFGRGEEEESDIDMCADSPADDAGSKKRKFKEKADYSKQGGKMIRARK